MALTVERMNKLTIAVSGGVPADVACYDDEERDFYRNAQIHRDLCRRMGLAVGMGNEFP